MTVTKTITTRANQKPWVTAEVCGLLKTRDEAFRSGDKAALKTARANLSCGIKNVKRTYAQKSIITSQTAVTNRACGKPFRPSLTTSPRHWPVMMTHPSRMHPTTFIHGLKCRMTHLHKNSHTSQRPGTLSVSSRRKDKPI